MSVMFLDFFPLLLCERCRVEFITYPPWISDSPLQLSCVTGARFGVSWDLVFGSSCPSLSKHPPSCCPSPFSTCKENKVICRVGTADSASSAHANYSPPQHYWL